jgi:thioesterase domain-containing protein
MNTTAVCRYLHDHIPLSKAMAVAVRQADFDQVVLQAPLKPNINHRDTVFGGSASALAILAAWALLYVRLHEAGINSRLVIQRNSMEYTRAIVEEFEAVARLEDALTWQRFVRTLERKQRARIRVSASLSCRGERVGEMVGEFVALGMGDSH